MENLKLLARRYGFIFKIIYKSNKLFLFMTLITTIIIGGTPIFLSVLFKYIVSKLENSFYYEQTTYLTAFLWLIIAYVALIFIRDLTIVFRNTIYKFLSLSLSYNIQNQIVEKLKNLEYYVFFNPDFQDLYALIQRGFNNEPIIIIQSFLFMGSFGLELIGRIGILANFNFALVLLLGISFLPNIICKLSIKKNEMCVLEKQMQNNRLSNYYFSLTTSKETTKEIREYILYDYFSNKRTDKYKQIKKDWKSFYKTEIKLNIFSQLIAKLGIIIAVIFLLTKIINKQTSVANFIFYFNTIMSFQDIYFGLIENLSLHYSSMLFIDKLYDFMQIKETIKNGRVSPKKGPHVLELKDVWFKYKGTNKYVLKGINCKFMTGETVCIIGKNGCGKTTLIDLLLRNYDPSKGEIFLDGVNIKKYDITKYRQIFRQIKQNYTRYAIPIDESIKIGNIYANPDLNKICLAAKKSTASEFIDELKYGYNTNLTKVFDKEGAELSGGQWQKLSIARVFFSDADILIFDEPTSAIDPEAESQIYQEIEKNDVSKLKIFISHRMYRPQKATKVIILDNGKIVGSGIHDILIKKSKKYSQMFNLQLNKYK